MERDSSAPTLARRGMVSIELVDAWLVEAVLTGPKVLPKAEAMISALWRPSLIASTVSWSCKALGTSALKVRELISVAPACTAAPMIELTLSRLLMRTVTVLEME